MNIEFLKSLLLDPLKERTPAQATLASWIAKCNAGIGGDNLFHHDGRAYVIGILLTEQANGAIKGDIFRFTPDGLAHFGPFKVASDGTVERMPEPLRDVLTAPSPENSPQS